MSNSVKHRKHGKRGKQGYQGLRGLMGVTGATGATGETGETGETGASGEALGLGDFWITSTQVVSQNSYVSFDAGTSSREFSVDGADISIGLHGGYYQVLYKIFINSSATFILELNGDELDDTVAGLELTSPPNPVQLVGMFIIIVGENISSNVLRLKNISLEPLDIILPISGSNYSHFNVTRLKQNNPV